MKALIAGAVVVTLTAGALVGGVAARTVKHTRQTAAAATGPWPAPLIGTWKGTTCGQPSVFIFYHSTVHNTESGYYRNDYDTKNIIAVSRIVRNGQVRYDHFILTDNPDPTYLNGSNPDAKSSIELSYANGAITGGFYVWRRGCDVSLSKTSSGLDPELTNRDDDDFSHLGDVFE